MSAALQELLDRSAITDTLLRYASTIDTKDFPRLRSVFADDAVATYAGGEPLVGADAIVAWIESAILDRTWQHHRLQVYEIALDGDVASTLTYHTSHSTGADPDTVLMIVARYDDELRRLDGNWKITKKAMHVGWIEQRSTST